MRQNRKCYDLIDMITGGNNSLLLEIARGCKMNNNLLMITHEYPLDKGDTAFVSSEMDALSKSFDHITVLRLSTEKKVKKIKVPRNCTTCHLEAEGKLRLFLKTVFSSRFRTNLYLLQEELIDIKTKKKVSFRNYLNALAFYLKAVRICNRISQISQNGNIPYLIYSFWSGPEVLACTMLQNKKIICARAHGYDLYEERTDTCYQPFKMVMDRRIDLMLFISVQGMNYYISKYATESMCKYVVSYLGSHGRRETAYYITLGDTIELLSISAAAPVKRLDIIVKALSVLDPDIKVHWTHIGDGEEMNAIRSLAEESLSNRNNISYSFLGFLDHEAAMNYLDSNDFHVLINTSSSEGLPVSMMEALSFSIPIIGTDVGGVNEIIDGTNGILLPNAANARDYAAAIELIAKLDNASYRELRKSAYEKWLNCFNADTNYNAMIEQIKAIVSEKK